MSPPSRYSLQCTGTPGAKARIRTVLNLMGFADVRIVENEIDASEPKPKPDNLPSSPTARAVAALFGRKPDQPWADDEIRALRDAVKSTLLTMETIEVVAAFYARERRREGHFCRTSILTFCRHFGTELDKARASKPAGEKRLEWTPANVVPMQDEAETERIRVATLAQIRERREAQ